ncbi:hypothetical protein ACLQ3D_29270 [Micromonospora vinacea]|uniref:Lipoprotein n=1 Tax=Micromonospora vinacea TaxID=709878 RepID=A0ABS0K2U2_9ACTN|nr:hypothetical protein [Micromonospora vinacea]MBG6102312.1 hypothetical protein [Micromonospora vinacea]WSZ74903.1 hypothetical protein OH804_23610 [Micromonospora sp. NBC_00860]WTA68609.1 hypothetical protein OHB51_05445 [Micromonospora sp. NBC_00855]
MRARRLAAVATVALGLVALSGCRAEPGIAAYIGDQRITEVQVTAAMKDLRTKNPAPETSASGQPAAPQPTVPEVADVVRTMVLTRVCEKLSAEKNYQPRGQVAVDQAAQQLGLDPETGHVREVAKLFTCLSGLPAEPAEPSKEEIADVIAAGRAAGKIPAELSDADAAQQLDGEQLRGALATKRILAEAAGRYDVTVSPRYRPLEFPLLSFADDAPAVSVPLGEPASDAVTDISTPEGPTATPEAEGTAS